MIIYIVYAHAEFGRHALHVFSTKAAADQFVRRAMNPSDSGISALDTLRVSLSVETMSVTE